MPHSYTSLIHPLKRAAERVALELDLSEAEKSVLAGMLMGLNNKDIAQTLKVTCADAKWHAHQIFTKSGHASREALTREVLLHELKRYRDRVQVCDLDIAAAGLEVAASGEESPRLLAWCEASDDFWHEPGTGIYRVRPNGDMRLCVGAQDEPCEQAWQGVTGRRFVRFDADTINALAEAVGRAPLDVLDEIAQALD